MPSLGTLIIIVMKARNLPNKVKIGKQNPYAALSYGIHKKKTSTIERGGQNPEWDEEFRFEIIGDEDDDDEAVEAALVTRSGAVLPVPEAGSAGKLGAGGMPAGSPRAVKTKGKTLLKVAAWADDSKDPTLIGETVIDIAPILKKGASDAWWKLEKKGRDAGEMYLEMTFYSNKPPPPKPVSTIRPPSSAYGGAGSRVASTGSDSDEPDELSSPHPSLTIDPSYPDPDLAPLARSMSTLSFNNRPSLPPTPVNQLPYQGRPSSPYTHAPASAPGFDRRASAGSYGPLPTPGPSVSHQQQQPQQQGYGTIGGGGGEYQALAQQHYASQGASWTVLTSSPFPTNKSAHSTAYASQAPTPVLPYSSQTSTSFHPPSNPTPTSPQHYSQSQTPTPAYNPYASQPPPQAQWPTPPQSQFNPYTTFSPPPVPPTPASYYAAPPQPPQPPNGIPSSSSFAQLGFPPPPPPPPELLATNSNAPYHQSQAQPHYQPQHQQTSGYYAGPPPIPPPTPPTWQGGYNSYSNHGSLPQPPPRPVSMGYANGGHTASMGYGSQRPNSMGHDSMGYGSQNQRGLPPHRSHSQGDDFNPGGHHAGGGQGTGWSTHGQVNGQGQQGPEDEFARYNPYG